MIIRREVCGEPVRLIALPPFTRKADEAWQRFAGSADVFGLDVESTAIEGLGTFDASIKMRLIQFGNSTEAWALDPMHPGWRKRIVALLKDTSKRFVSHNAEFDTTRVLFEFGIDLGERSLDTLPMAALVWPGRTAPNGKGLKGLSTQYIDSQLADADHLLHALFVDSFYAAKVRKTRLLPVSFVPGVSQCRRPKGKGEKCTQASWEGSACGYCLDHYLERSCSAEIETWGWRNIALDNPVFLAYAGLDAIYVVRLLYILAGEIRTMKMGTLSRSEQKIKRLCIGSARRGMRVDLGWTDEILNEVSAEFADTEERIEMVAGCKARSPKMAEWLREQGLRVKSLDKDHLPELIERYGDDDTVGPVLHDLALISKNANLLSNLRTIRLHATEGDGFVHPNINTQQAHTGRMSYTKPAMQTLAKKGEKGYRLRGCFLAREGHVLVGADYDSQEIRIGAALSQDEMMLKIVREGLNQHVLTAASLYENWVSKSETPEMYAHAKALDFAQQYGAFPRRIAATLKISQAEATDLWQRWRHTYAGLVAWSARVAKYRLVRNPYGRVIPRDPFRDYANANYLIQSTGRDILGAAMLRLDEAGWGECLWMAMHDELILEVPEDRADAAIVALTEHMSTSLRGIEIPAEGELIGTRWTGVE